MNLPAPEDGPNLAASYSGRHTSPLLTRLTTEEHDLKNGAELSSRMTPAVTEIPVDAVLRTVGEGASSALLLHLSNRHDTPS